MTAVTNSAVDSASTRVMSQVAGTIVRYGRIANPTTSQATTHTAMMAPAYWLSVNSPLPVCQHEADQAPERGPQDTDVADQRLPSACRRPGSRSDRAGRSA